MKSICEFIPSKNDNGNLKTIHFVYESEYQNLKWPQVAHIYYLFLVTKGSGVLTLPEFESHPLTPGTVFFILPGVRYVISGSDDLKYMYISFMGTRAPELMEELGVSMVAPTYQGFSTQIPFWRQSIQRICSANANLITEGVLLYTLSYLPVTTASQADAKHSDVLQGILNYIDLNFCNPDLSLKRIAEIFGYTDKYLSHLFKQEMNVNWSIYLNRLRIQHAIKLIEKEQTSITLLAELCGFADSLYFSKVFKKMVGKTPHVYIKERETKQV